jgi:hypothetical protein
MVKNIVNIWPVVVASTKFQTLSSKVTPTIPLKLTVLLIKAIFLKKNIVIDNFTAFHYEQLKKKNSLLKLTPPRLVLMHGSCPCALLNRKGILAKVSSLLCFALAMPVMADTFDISSGTSTNGGNTLDGGDTITVTGALETPDSDAGIFTTGGTNSVIVSSSGSIKTGPGDNAYGIKNTDSNNTTTILGSITTTGTRAYGIMNGGDSNTTTISGSIATDGDAGFGIYNYGDNSTTSILGNITTAGDHGYSIRNQGNSNTTTMSGSITSVGSNAHAITNLGNTNTTTISGSITTAADYTHAIYNIGNANTTTMSGSLTTAGVRAYGIYNHGSNNKTTMSGSIATGEDAGFGIYNNGDSNTATMSGSITSAGIGSRAIINIGNSNTMTMSGSITTSGSRSHAITNNGSSNTTTISGIVKAIWTDSSALYNYSGSGNSFSLDEGATIIGDITALAAATNNTLSLNLGQDVSYAYSVGGSGVGTGAGQWTFTDQDGRTPVVTTSGTNCAASGVSICNLVTTMVTDNAEAQDELQFIMNNALLRSFGLGAYKKTHSESGSLGETPHGLMWAHTYGGTAKRDASPTDSSLDTLNYGLTIGTPIAFVDGLNVDLIFNTSHTKLDINSGQGLTQHQEIIAKSYNIGVVVHGLTIDTNWNVDAFGVIGRNAYQGLRKVMTNNSDTGSETVTAAYAAATVLAGVDAQYSKRISETLSFKGGVNASLGNEQIFAYEESKYFAWDARRMMQITAGITAGFEYQQDALTMFFALSPQGAYQCSSKIASYSNNGTYGAYTSNSRGEIYRTASVGFDYEGYNSMSVTGAVERLSSTGGVSGNSTSLSVKRKF